MLQSQAPPEQVCGQASRVETVSTRTTTGVYKLIHPGYPVNTAGLSNYVSSSTESLKQPQAG
jgi:hypothetical protein